MKKLLVALAAVLSLITATPAVVYAQNAPNDEQTLNEECTANPRAAFCRGRDTTGNPLFGPDGILTKVAAFLAVITGVISLFIMTIAGLRFITSGGSSEKVNSARQAIIYSSIGLAVAAGSGAIVIFILNRL